MFYVYRLIDPRDSTCFYIGKGKGQRAWNHQRLAQYGRIDNVPKHKRIIAILSESLDVTVQIVARFEEERMAYAHEYDLIQSTPGLTNIAPGIGPVPSKEDVLQARRLAKVRYTVQSRKSQHGTFVRGLPVHLQAVAVEWLKSLPNEKATVAVPGDERKITFEQDFPPGKPVNPGGTSLKRSGKRRLRRKYPKRSDWRLSAASITIEVPPKL